MRIHVMCGVSFIRKDSNTVKPRHSKRTAIRLMLALVHAGFGFSSNAFLPFSLFLGTDSYIGSFFGFLAIAYQGPVVGLFVLLSSALGALVHGDLGFCAVSFLEALGAFLYYRGGGRNVALADTGFWAVGLWLLAIVRLLEGYAFSEALLSGAMIAVFGVFAATAASLLSDLARRLPSNAAIIEVLGNPRSVPFRRIIFETSSILAMVPFLLFMVATSWTRIHGLEREVGTRLESLSVGYERMIPLWMEAKIARLNSLALEVSRGLSGPALRGMLDTLESSGRDLASVGVLDPGGAILAIAADPSLRLAPLIRSDLSGTAAFADFLAGGESSVSLESDAGGRPLVLCVQPIEGSAGRSVFGMFTVDTIVELLGGIAGPTSSRGWILDRAGRVVAAFSPSVPPGAAADFRGSIAVDVGARPALVGAPRRYARASFSQFIDARFGSGWKAVFVVDLGPLYEPVISFALALSLFAFVSIVCIVLASAYTSKIVVSSLERLGTATRSFMDRFLRRETSPRGKEDADPIDWPDEGVEEILVLARAFQEAGELLDSRYRETLAALELAERANCAKRDLLSAVSHDIRGPMAGIVGVAERLEADLGDLTASADARLIKETGSRLAAFVEELLDRSALDDGRIELRAEIFLLRGLFDAAIGMFSAAARRKGLDLRCAYDERLPVALVGDRARLFQILGNLIGNAVKYTSSGGVVVSASLDAIEGTEASIRFEVADTGPGIKADFVDRIFDPYYRIDQADGGAEVGMGLGLHLARGLARLMSGDVRVDSVPEKGSVFVFVARLPIAAADSVPEGSTAGAKPPAEPRHAPRVLVVDDLEISRNHVKRILKLAGCEVSEAADGEAAVRTALGSEFDAIFMDIDLPILDGRQAVRAILERSGERGTRAPLIFALTAYAIAGDRGALKADGFDGYIAKNGDAAPILEAARRAAFGRMGEERRNPADSTIRAAPFGHIGSADRVLDIDGLLEAYQGNREFLKTLLRAFVADGKQRIDEIRHGLERGDGSVSERSLHSLVNICGSGRAQRALTLFRSWETSLREGRAVPAEESRAALAEAESAVAEAEAYLSSPYA